jgi:hypothetical protein
LYHCHNSWTVLDFPDQAESWSWDMLLGEQSFWQNS